MYSKGFDGYGSYGSYHSNNPCTSGPLAPVGDLGGSLYPPGQQHYGQAYGQEYGQKFGQAYGQTFGQVYGQGNGQAFGQRFGQGYVQEYGQGYGQRYGQAYGQGYGFGGYQQTGSNLRHRHHSYLENFIRESFQDLSETNGPVNISNLVKHVNNYHASLVIVAPESLEKVDRAKDDVTHAWREMKDSCSWAERTLRGHQAEVKEKKSSDDKTSIGLSLLGSGSGLVTVGSLFTPVTWPVAAGSFLVSAFSAVGGIAHNQSKVKWETEVKSAISMIQSNLDDKVQKLNEQLQNVVESVLALIRDVLQDDEIAWRIKSYAESYQVSSSFSQIVNQFVKFGVGALPMATACTGQPVLPDPAGEFYLKCTETISESFFRANSSSVFSQTGRTVGGSQQFISGSSSAVRKGQGFVRREAEKNCVKVVKETSPLCFFLKVAGGALAVYSLGAEIYQLASTVSGMDDPHDLYSVIEKILDAIEKEKKRLDKLLQFFDCQ